MPAAEWDATPWPLQRLYLEGMSDDESVPLEWRDGGELDGLPAGIQPVTRKATTDAQVFDLGAMARELDTERRGRRQDGGG